MESLAILLGFKIMERRPIGMDGWHSNDEYICGRCTDLPRRCDLDLPAWQLQLWQCGVSRGAAWKLATARCYGRQQIRKCVLSGSRFIFSLFLSSLCAEISLFLNLFIDFNHPSFLPSHFILLFVPQFSIFCFPLILFFSYFLSLLRRSFGFVSLVLWIL